MVKTDNTAVSHFMSQPKLSSRQARWQELLAEFNFTLEYRAGRTNQVTDALSRQGQLATFTALALQGSEVSTNLQDQIRDLLTKDPGSVCLVQLVEQGKSRQSKNRT